MIRSIQIRLWIGSDQFGSRLWIGSDQFRSDSGLDQINSDQTLDRIRSIRIQTLDWIRSIQISRFWIKSDQFGSRSDQIIFPKFETMQTLVFLLVHFCSNAVNICLRFAHTHTHRTCRELKAENN